MAQSFLAGMTNYSEQTIMDIKEDIVSWIKYCQKIKAEFETTISFLKDNYYWDNKVPYDFRTFCLSMGKMCDTFCSDFDIVVKSIDADYITSREIALMKNIYKVSRENEQYCVEAYKRRDINGYWQEYGNPLFEKVETLYGDGRDFLVTLKDVSNAVARMEDYMKEDNGVNVSINGNNNSQISIGGSQNVTDNSIHIGDNNKISDSVIGNANKVDKGSGKESFWKKWWWAFVVPVMATVVGGVILFLLKMN